MECSEVKKIIFENADSDIPQQVREGVETHLAGCRSCAMHHKALRSQSEALRSLPKLHAPPHFLENVRMRVEKPSPSVGKRVRAAFSDLFGAKSFYKLAATAAAAVLVVVTAQMILKDAQVRHEARVATPLPSQALAPRAPSTPPAEPAPPVHYAPPADAAPSVASAPTGPGQSAPSAPHQPPPADKMMERQSARKALSEQALRASAPSAGEEAQPESVALILKIPQVSAPKKAAGGSALVERAKRPSAANSGAAAPGRQSMEFSQPVAPEEAGQLKSAFQADLLERVISEVMRLIRLANGKILSEPPAADGKMGPLLTEIPAENYPGFLDQLRGLGETEFKGEESKNFIPRPKSKVKVSVTFDARQ